MIIKLKKEMTLTESELLNAIVSKHCSHIRKPYTLEEICEQVRSNEYNAEIMLLHLLLWVSGDKK